jgi:hypothetical protein
LFGITSGYPDKNHQPPPYSSDLITGNADAGGGYSLKQCFHITLPSFNLSGSIVTQQ